VNEKQVIENQASSTCPVKKFTNLEILKFNLEELHISV